MSIIDILDRLSGVKQAGKDEWMARCPGHDDDNASLSLSTGKDGRVLLHCHAGCTVEAITGALGLTLSDLFEQKPDRNGTARIVATYDYQDAAGKLLYQVVRFEQKEFRQRRPDSHALDGWSWSIKGVKRVLFRLPETLAAVAAGKIIWIAEGEKDVAALVERGCEATTNSGGAGKWNVAYSESLRLADVVVIADRDEPGRKHAADVADKLRGVAKRVRVIELPDVDGHQVKDAHDFFFAGGTAEQLRKIADSAPDWKREWIHDGAGSNFETITAWVRGELVSLLLAADMTPSAKRAQIAQRVVEALGKLGRFYFHQDLRDFDSAMYFDGHRKRLARIRSDAFGAWLSDWLNVNRADPLFKFVTAQVETAALSGEHATAILPEAFWATRPGTIYLSNGDGHAVKITRDAVATVDNGTNDVLFAAGRTLSPWKVTTPRDPFETCTVFQHAHSSATHGLDLLRLWVYSLPTIPPSKPPICLVGDVGAGKTRTAKAIAELYGLPFVAAKVEEDSEGNFWPNVDQGGLLTLDNADSRCKWLADSIANAATDGCSQRRRLYTNAETVVLRARAWLCVTTANPTFAADAGLADRLLVLRMERREEITSDASLTAEILAARNGALSHIAAVLQKAIADTAPTPPRLNARHPDFASFAVRIGRALGRETESIAALRAAESDKAAFCLENDNVASALLVHLREVHRFNGTAAELVQHLVAADPDLQDRLSAKRLGKRLCALWPHLKKILPTARKESGRTGITVFTFKISADAIEQTDPPQPEPAPVEEAV